MSNSFPAIASTSGSELARRVKRAAQDLFGLTTRGNEIAALADLLEEDVATVMERRVPGTVIAFVGGKNAGKTTLVSLLVEGDLRQELQRNAGNNKDTIHLCWVGGQAPKQLDKNREEFLVATPQMGSDCWLLDCPSYAAGSTVESDGADYGLLLADINILVVTEAEIRSQINVTKITSANGSIVVPVVRKEASESEWTQKCSDPDFLESVEHFEQRLRKNLPESKILPSVVVPRFETWGSTPSERKKAEELCARLLRDAVRHALLSVGMAPRRETMAKNREHSFRIELKRKLGGEIERLRGPLDQLKTAKEQLPAQVIESLVGSEEVLSAGVRSRMLMNAPSKLWMIWFPFRSITWLLALTAGAWDRLILAMAGNVPSLALTFFTAARNVRNLGQLKRQTNAAFRPQLERALIDRLRPSLAAVHVVVLGLVSANDSLSLPRTALSRADLRLHGFDAMKEASAGIFTSCLKEFRVPVWWMQICGLAATSVFGWLIWHPLRSLYDRYLEANAWQDFPTPEASMIITSMLLSVTPVLLVSIVCLSIGMALAHVDQCVSTITQRHNEATKKLAKEGILRLELANPQVEAALHLLTISSID
jgi:hypothetical protein